MIYHTYRIQDNVVKKIIEGNPASTTKKIFSWLRKVAPVSAGNWLR